MYEKLLNSEGQEKTALANNAAIDDPGHNTMEGEVGLSKTLRSLKKQLSDVVTSSVVQRARHLASEMVVPGQVSKVMADIEGSSVHIVIVHNYESPSTAIVDTKKYLNSIEDGVPDAYFEFSYVHSERFAAEDFSDFVDLPVRPE